MSHVTGPDYTAADHSGDGLHTIPISLCGLRLTDEAVRIAFSLNLGTELCQTHAPVALMSMTARSVMQA
jgi:hypothetical protein